MKKLKDIIKKPFINKKGEPVIVLPIHYKSVPASLREDVSAFNDFISRPHNREMFETLGIDPAAEKDPHKIVSQYITSTQPPLSSDEKKAVKAYSFDSRTLNRRLIDNHLTGKPDEERLSPDHAMMHQIMKGLTSRRFGHSLTVFSGLGFDPQEYAAGSAKGVIHSPAYISATHNPMIAAAYSKPVYSAKGEERGRHIAQINIEPDDKAFFVGRNSKVPDEHETIIPAGTSLRYHETEQFNDNGPVNVHHFTIHRQK